MTRRDALLVILLLLAACWVNWDEAHEKRTILESESYPGQLVYDGSWHAE